MLDCDQIVILKVSFIVSQIFISFRRWKALERVCKVQMELAQFLKEIDSNDARTTLDLSLSEEIDLVFLVDIMGHLNQLNRKLQGEKKNVGQMWQAVNSFIAKLGVFQRDIAGSKDHFLTLKTFVNERMDRPDMVQESCAKADMEKRFEIDNYNLQED